MSHAVEFEASKDELHLLYSPRDEPLWVQQKFDRGEELIIKGTFHLTRAHLVRSDPDKFSREDLDDEYPLRFKIAELRGNYFWFDPDVLPVGRPVLLDKKAQPTWKWFSAERAVSIVDVIAQLGPRRVVIGGEEPDAIPIADYEKLVAQFPTPHELKRYTSARVASVVRDYVETPVDAEKLYRSYVEKRIKRNAVDFRAQFHQQDAQKYKFLLEKLKQMLSKEVTYPESAWQVQILQIILLLNPKYVKAFQNVHLPSDAGSAKRFLDLLLVDASGNVDVIEIKKPFGKSVVTQAVYRDNHIPLRELSGSVMQIEKYIYRLSRWGHLGEKALTSRYASELPRDFHIRITNPSGIIIIGRDSNLTSTQRQDFEFVRRKYKSIVDIITYDDLSRRLKYVVSEMTRSGKGANGRVPKKARASRVRRRS